MREAVEAATAAAAAAAAAAAVEAAVAGGGLVAPLDGFRSDSEVTPRISGEFMPDD